MDSAASCEKCTRYSGASPLRRASSTVPSSGISTYSYDSGTGRGASATTSPSIPVRALSDAAMFDTSPNVALMSRNCVFGSVSSGTCHAQPRSASP